MRTENLFSSEVPALLQRHLDALRLGSGLSLEIIRERGYRSILRKKELAEAGFAKSQQRPPGMLMPIHPPDGSVILLCYKPDFPRIVRDKELKYELPHGTTSRLDVPPRCLQTLKDPSIELWVTEGVKKADALAGNGLCALALLGVWNFKGKNEFGGVTLLADFDEIGWNHRKVNIVFDSDVMTKRQVRDALDRIIEHLQRRGAAVNAVFLPRSQTGDKVGVDDYLLEHSIDDLNALVSEPPPAPKPAASKVEWLDEAPEMLARPLSYVDGHAYAATWLWVRNTTEETLNKDGEVVRHDPPLVLEERTLVIVRDDGQHFGPDNMEDLGLQVKLPDIPPENQLWRTAAVKAYVSGTRPDPTSTFEAVVSVFDNYIDFGRSFADQHTMCELSACFSLATWFFSVFTVLGYPWPNGERGSGKTQWGFCWAHTSYLGVVVLASGSFAALRDLADYGASLLFDDAENLSDPKRADPDKRTLFLAGNRKGATIPVKEPSPNGRGWQTRWVNAFCPRGFTAISLPDVVLASRSIRLPLVRTFDPKKGNSDPADFHRWPCNQRQLQDNLWATALGLMAEAAEIWGELDNETELIGREFEPWRPLMAVARLFERHGVAGLENRIRQAMRAYQEEKAEIDTGDRATQVLNAILFQHHQHQTLADVSDVLTKLDVSPQVVGEIIVNSGELVPVIKQIGEEESFDTEWASSRSVGWQLKSLRFKRDRDAKSKKRTRFWTMDSEGFNGLCRAYGLIGSKFGKNSPDIPNSETSLLEKNVRNGFNVQNVQPEAEIVDEVRL